MAKRTRNGLQGDSSIAELNQCRFCHRSFVKETSLAAHLCEPKRRYQNRSERSVQIGFQAFREFFAYTQDRERTIDDFDASPFYTAFVKLGHYVIDVQCVNVSQFIRWLIRSNRKIDQWARDSTYSHWLTEWLPAENHMDAVERSLATMLVWADQTLSKVEHYFLYASTMRICNDISKGRVSAWAVYASTTGGEWISALDSTHFKLIQPYVDPAIWSPKLLKNRDEYNEAVALCKEIGL